MCLSGSPWRRGVRLIPSFPVSDSWHSVVSTWWIELGNIRGRERLEKGEEYSFNLVWVRFELPPEPFNGLDADPVLLRVNSTAYVGVLAHQISANYGPQLKPGSLPILVQPAGKELFLYFLNSWRQIKRIFCECEYYIRLKLQQPWSCIGTQPCLLIYALCPWLPLCSSGWIDREWQRLARWQRGTPCVRCCHCFALLLSRFRATMTVMTWWHCRCYVHCHPVTFYCFH